MNMDSDTLDTDAPSTRPSHTAFTNTSCPTDRSTRMYAPTTQQTKHRVVTDATCSQNYIYPAPYLQQDETLVSRTRTEEHDPDMDTPSLYGRLKSFFHPKSKPATLPTPPASPQNYKSCDLGALSLSPSSRDQGHSTKPYEALFLDTAERTLSSSSIWTPLTPESVDHHCERGSDSWPSLVGFIEEYVLGEEQDKIDSEPRFVDDNRDLLDGLEPETHAHLTDIDGQRAGLCLKLDTLRMPAEAEVDSPEQDVILERGEGVHLIGEDDWPGRPRVKSVQWGKTQAPPIQWDVLIDDLSSPISPVWDATFDRPGLDYAYDTPSGIGCDEDGFYDLQYALELSRRDRRKIMDLDPDSAGEYSKSRKSWAVLHSDRVKPFHQEYWFKHWLQWHSRLEVKTAFKLDRAKRKEEYKCYQLVDPWPTTDHRTARHPRRADEDLHPNLRLMRHRTRSAPGRIYT